LAGERAVFGGSSGRAFQKPIITPWPMLEERIKEPESQRATAGETVAALTRLNAEPTARRSGAETRNRKLKRPARRDESSYREQLAAAQSKRG
jgi:hypothetical protein